MTSLVAIGAPLVQAKSLKLVSVFLKKFTTKWYATFVLG